MNTVDVIPNLPDFDLENLSENLPQDLNNKIYSEYFLLKKDCDYVLNWLNNNHRLDKNINEIYDLVTKLLRSQIAIEYLINKNKYLKTSYNYHFLKNQKNFDLMDNVGSFITATLMYMWH